MSSVFFVIFLWYYYVVKIAPQGGINMPSKLPQFTIRIDPLLLKKLRYVAEYNARSANREVEMLIKKHVANYEKEFGKINFED